MGGMCLFTLLALSCAIPGLYASKHSVPTFLHRLDELGVLADVDHPSFKTHLQYEFAGKHVRSNLSGKLSVSEVVVSDGEDIMVSWSGIADASATDWIGVYCPADSTEDDYLDFMYVNISSTWKSGSGSFPLKIFNMRQDYEFRYYQVRGGSHYIAAVSPRVTVRLYEPCAGHLAMGNEIDSMVLMWTSGVDHELIVQYSVDPEFSVVYEIPDREVTTHTYTAEEMCGAPANTTTATTFRSPGFQVTATFRNLSLGTQYFYRYGIYPHKLQTGNFRTPMKPGLAKSSRFIAFGDFGVHYRPYFWEQPGAPMVSDMLVKEIQESEVDAILLFGDLAYGVGHGYIWDQWGWLMSQTARYVPYMIGVGNHEYDHTQPAPGGMDISHTPGVGFHPSWAGIGDDSFGECAVPVFKRFKMPAEKNGGNSVFWYSFDRGMVRFIMMSSEHDYHPGTVQYTWLEKVLSSTDRNALPWVVMMLHRPMYSNESDSLVDNIVANHEREIFEDLIVKYRVNLMFSAHYHSYMRSCPVIKSKCQAPGTAPVHVVVGTAGANLQLLNSTFPADWTVKGAVNFGYSILEANSTHLHMDWISQDLNTHDRHIADSVDIPLWKS